ncbi:hypothetical protein E2C01_032897 [Portunus trituberculatus]|uniref:Uncharacterized protein n=1 Tax=Portunus trituberculatus TaxID=210409 RepID=A0A5B7EX44_PORTR|nr:hypothetical protein [Portunus trituberculatus]
MRITRSQPSQQQVSYPPDTALLLVQCKRLSGSAALGPLFSPLFFDEDKLQEALHSCKSNADMALHKASVGGAWLMAFFHKDQYFDHLNTSPNRGGELIS